MSWNPDRDREKNKVRCKAWYEANRERVAARRKARYEARSEEEKARRKAYREKHREENRAYQRVYQKANRVRHKVWQVQNRETRQAYKKARREANKEEILEYNRDWYDRNVEYACRKSADRHRRRIKAIPALNNGQRWTAEEDTIVMRDNLTLTQMCFLTGRGYSAVHAHRAYLAKDRRGEIRRTRPKRPPWTSEEDIFLMRDDLTVKQMAVRLGRSYSAVVQHRQKLLRRQAEQKKSA